MKNLIASLALVLLCSCAHVGYDKVDPKVTVTETLTNGTVIVTVTEGGKTHFAGNSAFSNSALKGATVGNATAKSSTGLKLTGTTTEPNPESITATGSALGDFAGTVAATVLKGK